MDLPEIVANVPQTGGNDIETEGIKQCYNHVGQESDNLDLPETIVNMP
jgi:hypothetical protein